ncbi:restriction endonuclease subunit S [Helicobacter labetoulli]|uniref:restriction endonuclease subunit S n=1 Tax=Helicobacter labetoulli TaxID=2315333 RepID=UPI001FC9639F|nr:restriction endonuclease subunit S [Helicobacter labetoulli]
MPKASYPSINADDIKALKIPLPPLKEQEKIVAKIDFIEAKITQLESKKDEILLRYLS